MARVTLSATRRRLGVAAVIGAVTLWGSSNLFVKLTTQPAVSFAVYRLWTAALLLVGVLALRRSRITIQMIRSAAPSGIFLAVEIAFFFSALKATSVADVTVISSLQPLMIMAVAPRLFGDRITIRHVAWATFAFVGVALVVLGSSGTPVWSLRGDLLAVCALLAWVAYFLGGKSARATVPTLQYVAVVFIVGGIVMTPLALLLGQPLGWNGDWSILHLVLFILAASGGHLLLNWAHPLVDASISSLLTLLQPVISSIGALVMLGEPITLLTIVGGVIVLTSVAGVLLHVSRRREGEKVLIPAA